MHAWNELLRQPLPVRQHRREMRGEVADATADDRLALGLQFRGDSVPALDDRPSRLEQPGSRRVGDRRRGARVADDTVELLARRIGLSPSQVPRGKRATGKSPAISYFGTEVISVVTTHGNDSRAGRKMDGFEC